MLRDRPLPYPAERENPARDVSLYFWYSSIKQKSATHSSLILVPSAKGKIAGSYREIEFVADLLAQELLRHSELAAVYALKEDSLREVND